MNVEAKPIVYSYRRCPFAIRVRMTLHEKGVDFVTYEENLKDFSTELRNYHPEAKVPVLVDNDTIIYESAIITEYVDENFSGPAMMPHTPSERASVRLWTYWCNHILKPDLDRFKYGTSRYPEPEIAPATNRLEKHLEKLDSRLKSHSWLVGDTLSLADIHCFPFYRQLTRTTPEYSELHKYCHVAEWLQRIIARPAFTKTMARKQI